MEEASKYVVDVTYRVEGSGSSVAITYTVGVAHTATDTAASLPWTKVVATGGTVSLTAMNGQSGGTITCRIFANGEELSEQTAAGPLASASCIGDVGLLPAR
jgi:Mycobacterium membrane protein